MTKFELELAKKSLREAEGDQKTGAYDKVIEILENSDDPAKELLAEMKELDKIENKTSAEWTEYKIYRTFKNLLKENL